MARGVPCTGWRGDVTGGAMTEAVANADGTFTLTFAVDADALPEDRDATITYTAFMREQYQDGSLTTSGDVLTNTVDISGTTTPPRGTPSTPVTSRRRTTPRRAWARRASR